MNISNSVDALRFSSKSILVHMAATGLLLGLTWGKLDSFYVFNWTAIVITLMLGSLLGLSLFKRKASQQPSNIKAWKTKYAYLTGLISATLSTGYCYGVFAAGVDVANSLALIMAFHISFLAASTIAYKKIFGISLLTLAIPFIASLIYLNTSVTLVLGVSLSIFISALIVCNILIHRAIKSGLLMTKKYDNEVKVSNDYKSKFEEATFKDPLTKLFNRRFFDLMIFEEIRRAKRAETNLSLAIIEIDNFQEYIDYYGEPQGNNCIASIAKILKESTSRGGEFMNRFSHNQFALIAPNVSTDEAIAFMSKMIDCVNLANIEHKNTQTNNLSQVSVSAGITEFKAGNIIDVNEIVHQAQSALRIAKQRGPNNIEVCSRNEFNNESSNIHSLNANSNVRNFRVA